MTSLLGIWWDFLGSPGMPEYEVMRLPMSLQGEALLWGFLDLSRPWESLDRKYRKM
jgi:hypothetical protein